MAARSGQKIKLFYIVDILKSDSDENHPLTATEICDKLAKVGVSAERKAIYDDIECLINYGFDIIKTRTPKNGFFLGEREFEIPEIYLLADAVKTAKFISAKKTRELISKLNKMQSRYESGGTEHGIYFDTVGKTKNEEIFYSIDAINSAIKNGHKIKFKYGIRSLSSDRQLVLNYKEHTVSPYAMTWQDDNYYLIANNEKYDNFMHLRIDRMKSVSETDLPSRKVGEFSDYKNGFDVSEYTSKLFGMFGGEMQDVTLRCNKSILEPMIDRFGTGIFVKDVTDSHFTFTVNAAVSSQLVTFIMNYGEDIEVLSPKVLRENIKEQANKIIKLYKKED